MDPVRSNMSGMKASFVAATALAVLLVMLPAVSVAQTLIVVNKNDATMSFIDPATGKTLGSVPTGEAPHEAAVSTDGKLAFAANYGAPTPGNTISVIDIATRKEVRKLDVSPLRRPHGLFAHEGKLYFTAEVNRTIARYDPATNKIDWILGTGQPGTHMVMANKDGSVLFTANIGGDSMSVIERGNNPLAWNVTIVPVGKGPEGFDLSPDGKQLWAAHSRDGAVSVIDVASKKVMQTIDAQTKRSNRLKFTPDGAHVLISDLDAGDLVVIDTASHKVSKRLPLGKQPEGILIVPDGSRAFVALAGDNQLAVVDLKTFEVTSHIPTGGNPDGMAWVPKS